MDVQSRRASLHFLVGPGPVAGNALLSDRLDDAQKWLEEAITLQPDDADAKVMLQLWRTDMSSSTMSLGARVSLLLVPLVTALDPAAAHATQSGDFAGLVDVVGGRKMYLECRGKGFPTVVLVAGLRGSAEDWNIAEKPGPRVFPEVAKFTRVCAYDRPGTPVGEKPSRSDPVHQPTTAGTAVADLHALLTAAGEAGPYVLVAHSYGGLIGRLYASTYPDDVCGLVLVDALSEWDERHRAPDRQGQDLCVALAGALLPA
jgi:hypothetical protein